ncbi:MAG: acyl-CoA dehydrogenase family protein, partial [Planctomycetota bacterium]
MGYNISRYGNTLQMDGIAVNRLDKHLKPLVDEERFSLFDQISRFAANEVAPHLLQWERDKQLVPDHLIEQLGEMGIFGLPIPEEYGGQDGEMIDLILAGLALSYWSPSVAITPGAAVSLGINPLLRFGSADQKA